MDIPEDVVAQILVRLPVKSLLRFRCVCKGWCGLIGSRRFIDTHLRHPSRGKANEYLVLPRFELDYSHPVLSFYCRDQDDVLKAAAPDLREFPNTLSIGGPVNGICLVGGSLDRKLGWDYIKRVGYDPGHEQPLYLCNPATREFRKIPDRPFGRQRARPPILCIGGAPFECMRVGAGFGYDHRADDYKVVSIMLFLENHYYSGIPPYGPLKIEIYDLNSNSWRVADTMFPTIDVRPDPGMDLETYPADLNIDSSEQGMFEYFTCGLFFNGSIHWNTSGYTKLILAFNISDEVMRAIHLPRGISCHESSYPRSMFLLEDSLAFVQRVTDENDLDENYAESTSFYVWVMVEYGDEESWMKRFYFQPETYMDVLAFWDDTLICETKEGELASCNLQEDAPQLRKHHHIQRYVQQGLPSWNPMGAMVMHKESLVRLR